MRASNVPEWPLDGHRAASPRRAAASARRMRPRGARRVGSRHREPRLAHRAQLRSSTSTTVPAARMRRGQPPPLVRTSVIGTLAARPSASHSAAGASGTGRRAGSAARETGAAASRPGRSLDVALVDPVGAPRRLDEALEEPERRQAHAHPAAVGALELPAPRIVGPRAAVGLAVDEEPARADRQERGVEQRDLDALAEAVAVARDQRHHHRDGAGQRGEARGHGHRGEARRGGVAVAAGGGGDDAFPRRHPGPRVVRGEAGQGAVDQARVVARGLRGPEAEAGHGAGPKVLHDDVGPGDQSARRGAVGPAAEVEHDVALAAVPRRVGRRLPPRAAGRVDVHDVGAVVGQQHRGERAGDPLAEVDDPDPVERPHRRRRLRRPGGPA